MGFCGCNISSSLNIYLRAISVVSPFYAYLQAAGLMLRDMAIGIDYAVVLSLVE